MSEHRTSDPSALPESDTPKTDAAQVVAFYGGHGGLFVEAAFAREQERRIAELEKALRATIPHMFVKNDNVWHQRAFALRVLDEVTP